MRADNTWSCNIPYLNIRKCLNRLLSLEQLVLNSSLVRTDTLDHECLIFRFVALKLVLESGSKVQVLH